MVQRLASAACQDGLRDPRLQQLAALGGGGQFPANVERDFHRRFTHAEFQQLPLERITLPMLDFKSRRPVNRDVWVLSPADILWAIHGLGPGVARAVLHRPGIKHLAACLNMVVCARAPVLCAAPHLPRQSVW